MISLGAVNKTTIKADGVTLKFEVHKVALGFQVLWMAPGIIDTWCEDPGVHATPGKAVWRGQEIHETIVAIRKEKQGGK